MHQSAQPPRLYSPFWPVIEKCLAKHPDRRFADVTEFRQAIEAVARDKGFQLAERAKQEDDIWAYRDKGNTLLRLGKYEAAIEAFDLFLAHFPDESALFNKAVCLENLGRIEEAMQLYDRFAKQGDYKACVNGANCLKRLGDYSSAMKFADRAIELEPEDPDCWIALGNVRYAMGIFEAATIAYQRAVTLSSSKPTPHYNLALARKQAGDPDGAERSIRRFLALSSPLDDRRSNAGKVLEEIICQKNTNPGFN
jgi:eukaryotic-like serine/threonine-protein kinase